MRKVAVFTRDEIYSLENKFGEVPMIMVDPQTGQQTEVFPSGRLAMALRAGYEIHVVVEGSLNFIDRLWTDFVAEERIHCYVRPFDDPYETESIFWRLVTPYVEIASQYGSVPTHDGNYDAEAYIRNILRHLGAARGDSFETIFHFE